MTSLCDKKHCVIYASEEGRGTSCYFTVNGFMNHRVGSLREGDVSHLIPVSLKYVQNILFLQSIEEIPAKIQISYPVPWPIPNRFLGP